MTKKLLIFTDYWNKAMAELTNRDSNSKFLLTADIWLEILTDKRFDLNILIDNWQIML